MKRALIWLAACAPGPIEPEQWQLDQDRVIAVRISPPGIVSGEHATIDGLLAHADGPVTLSAPSGVTGAPNPLYLAVNFIIDHYEVIAPDPDTLATGRIELGLATDAPIPFELAVFFGPLNAAHLNSHKLMYLGETDANPALPYVSIPTAFPIGQDLSLYAEASDVSWLTSCGALTESEEPAATLHLDTACDGQLVVVVRDPRGGVVWQVWPISSE
jgi:hypothetical protein